MFLGCLEGVCFASVPVNYDETVTSSIAATGIDLDFYNFEGTAGTEVRLIVKGTSGSVSPRVEIRNPDGVLVHAGGCFPGCESSEFNILPSATLAQSGTYTLAVGESGQNNWGNYQMFLGCLEGVCFASVPVNYDETAVFSIESTGIDLDFYNFEGAAGTEVRLIVAGTSGSVSPRVEIRDPNGVLVHAGSCSPGCESSEFNILPSATLALSGTYTLVVSESGQNNWGNYQIFLGCLVGVCPVGAAQLR